MNEEYVCVLSILEVAFVNDTSVNFNNVIKPIKQKSFIRFW